MDEKEILIGFLGKTLNKNEEEVSDLLYQKSEDSDEVTLKEGVFDLVLNADTERVKKLKKSAKPDKDLLQSKFDEGFTKGKAQVEAEMKKAAGLETDSIGADLVKEVINHCSECQIPSEEQIKASELYLALEKTRIPKEKYEELKTEFDDFKSNQDRIASLSVVRQDALSQLIEMKPVESENPKVAENRRKDFLSKLDNYDFVTDEEGDHVIKEKDGTRLEDKHGNPLKFSEFIKDLAEGYYDFQAQGSKGNAGNTGGNGSGGAGDVPKDEADYLAKMRELILKNDKEGVVKLKQAWESKS